MGVLCYEFCFFPYLITQAETFVLLLQAWWGLCVLLPTQEIKVHSMKSATSLLEPCLKRRNSSSGVIGLNVLSPSIQLDPLGEASQSALHCWPPRGPAWHLDGLAERALAHFLMGTPCCRRLWKRNFALSLDYSLLKVDPFIPNKFITYF